MEVRAPVETGDVMSCGLLGSPCGTGGEEERWRVGERVKERVGKAAALPGWPCRPLCTVTAPPPDGDTRGNRHTEKRLPKCVGEVARN